MARIQLSLQENDPGPAHTINLEVGAEVLREINLPSAELVQRLGEKIRTELFFQQMQQLDRQYRWQTLPQPKRLSNAREDEFIEEEPAKPKTVSFRMPKWI